MNILGLSGKLQSGKTTATNYIIGSYMFGIGLVNKGFAINKEGKLWISDLKGDKAFEGIFDIERKTPAMIALLNDYLNPYVRVYPLADPLKNIGINLLDLSYEQVYGTNEQKNTLTKCIVDGKPATGRQVMQWLGENLRRLYPDVYINKAIKTIKETQPQLAIINDVRYPNEVEKILEAGGKVVRLTRALSKNDGHESETSLDPDKFDWSKFSMILDNKNLSISKMNEKLREILVGWEMLPNSN